VGKLYQGSGSVNYLGKVQDATIQYHDVRYSKGKAAVIGDMKLLSLGGVAYTFT